MVKGEELGMSPIKCINKEGTEELKKIHYEVNDIFYKYKKKYITADIAGQISIKVSSLGIELKRLAVPEKAQAKKDEILAKLRAVALTVKHYMIDFKWQPQDAGAIQATINWEVKQLVDAKKNYDLWNDPIKYLDEIKEIKDFYIKGCPFQVNPDTLYNFNTEILGMIGEKYRIQ